MKKILLLLLCACEIMGCDFASRSYDVTGIKKYKAKDYQGAIIALTKSISLNPNDTIAYYYRAEAEMSLKQNEKAIKDFEQVIKVNHKNIDGYYNKANVEFDLGEFEAAIKDYDTCINLNPKMDQALYYRACTKSCTNDYTGAIEDFNRALETSRRNVGFAPDYESRIYINRGLMERQINKPDAAIKSFDTAIIIDPKCLRAYFNRGYVEYTLKEYDKAEEDYDSVFKINPESNITHLFMGLVYLKQGRQNVGCSEIQKAADMGIQGAADSLQRYCR